MSVLCLVILTSSIELLWESVRKKQRTKELMKEGIFYEPSLDIHKPSSSNPVRENPTKLLFAFIWTAFCFCSNYAFICVIKEYKWKGIEKRRNNLVLLLHSVYRGIKYILSNMRLLLMRGKINIAKSFTVNARIPPPILVISMNFLFWKARSHNIFL